MAGRVAIVAADVVTPLGPGLAPTLSALLAGRTAVAPIRGFDPSPFGVEVAAQLDEAATPSAGEGPTRVVTPHGALLERLARIVHDAAHAGEVRREDVGFFVGLGVVDSKPEALAPAIAASREGNGPFELARFFATGFRSIHPHWPLQMLNNVAVGQVAADLDLRGDNLVTSSEADAGARAIAEAAEAIRIGSVKAALVAGISDQVSPAALLRARMRGTPHDVLGEGGGALFLENEESVAARGRVPVGFLRGTGFAFEASDAGPGPSASAIVRAVRAALEQAGLEADDVGVVFVEGTGAEEAQARRDLFGDRRTQVATVAPAVALGSLRAGAPSVAMALATGVLALGHAPSMAHGRPRPLAKGSRALVLASGTAGHAAALVIQGIDSEGAA